MDAVVCKDTLLVCVYYRVPSADSGHAISLVREFQRTLRVGPGLISAEVLLRFGLPNSAESTAPVPARSPSIPDDALPAASPSSTPAAEPQATLMETYRIALPAPAGSAPADHAARAFLDVLEAASTTLARLLRGTRHVELFASCVS